MKFEVGQRVRDIGSLYTRDGEFELGVIGIVTAYDPGLPYPVEVLLPGEPGSYAYYEDELETIDE